MKIIAKKDFSIQGKDYIEKDEINNVSYEQIILLNEKGFIEPLSNRELILIKREIENSKIKKEDNNGTKI